MEYQKPKSAPKQIMTEGPQLEQLKLQTLKTISDLVGSTLGPNGKTVLIERFEHGLKPLVTKDGVTVIGSMAFIDASAQCILEAARDASVRTAKEAGDGTTTASVLAEAIVRNISQYCLAHPKVSPQKVIRRIEALFHDIMEPGIHKLSKKVDMDAKSGKRLLHAVARVSANGDVALADAVMKCFEYTGDEGNVTIVEKSGASGYSVEKIKGHTILTGYDESCQKFYPQFINDAGNQRCYLEKPIFILYHGSITEIQRVALLLEKIGEAWAADNESSPHNVVLVATGFSDSVLATLGLNFSTQDTINVYPMLAPLSQQSNGQLEFLHDISAVTGATIFNPLSRPLERATPSDLGGVEAFEAYRSRSSIIGYADESLLEARIDEITQMLENPDSELDSLLLTERKAKLSGGIAKLTVSGASTGELKEKSARADDAVCAVRGAIKQGTLPGGGWTLMKLCSLLPDDDVSNEILRPALMTPIERLLTNCGITVEEEAMAILSPIIQGIKDGKRVVYDFLEGKHVDPYKGGLLDSTPAVLEALRNSISIATLLGTLGGTVCFMRDAQLEREEARITANYMRDANTNPADERP